MSPAGRPAGPTEEKNMRMKLATYALAGALGLTGVAGAVLVAPAVSHAATGDSAALERRVSSLKDALKGLVGNGTITQAQADQVASTLAASRPEDLGGHRGHGGGGRGAHLEALSSLGITAQEVRVAAAAGKKLAQLAQEQGVSQDKLVSTLVAAGKARLADAVADGRLTQAEADEKAADLEARVRKHLAEPVRAKGGHRGGHHGPDSDAATPPSEPGSQTPADPNS
jgi:hypothetical protein